MADPRKGEVFDIRKTLVGDDAVGLLAKLLWEIEQLHSSDEENLLIRLFMSFNAASTAWHLHEWVWKLSNKQQQGLLLDAAKAETRDFNGFVRGLQKVSPAMAICRQIATAGKHMTVKYDRDDIFAEIVDRGDALHPAGGVVLVWSGERHPDISVYAAALKLWLKVYVDLGHRHAQDIAAAATWLDEDN